MLNYCGEFSSIHEFKAFGCASVRRAGTCCLFKVQGYVRRNEIRILHSEFAPYIYIIYVYMWYLDIFIANMQIMCNEFFL